MAHHCSASNLDPRYLNTSAPEHGAILYGLLHPSLGMWISEQLDSPGGGWDGCSISNSPPGAPPQLLSDDDGPTAAWISTVPAPRAPNERTFDEVAAGIAREQAAECEREGCTRAVAALMGHCKESTLAAAPLLPPGSFDSPPRFSLDGTRLLSEAERLQIEHADLLPVKMPRSRWGPEGNCGPAAATGALRDFSFFTTT